MFAESTDTNYTRNAQSYEKHIMHDLKPHMEFKHRPEEPRKPTEQKHLQKGHPWQTQFRLWHVCLCVRESVKCACVQGCVCVPFCKSIM